MQRNPVRLCCVFVPVAEIVTLIMFRPFQPFVTIITAQAGANSHYVSLGSGVECHLWAVTKARPLFGFRVFLIGLPLAIRRLTRASRLVPGECLQGVCLLACE